MNPHFLTALVALSLFQFSATQAQPAHAILNGGFASKLEPFVNRHNIAGAVVLVAAKDGVLACEAVGYSDLFAKKVMTTDQLFEIASMSKPIAATALMMLVDDGKVNVVDPVEKYLPEFREQMVIAEKDADHVLLKKPKQRLLVRHLLTHTGGILYSGPLEKPTLDSLPLRTVVAQHAMLPLQFEPGTKFLYSNGGIGTAARIVEVITGMPYEKFLDERLFTPLGMKDTTFWPNENQLMRLAKCYKANADKTDLVEAPLDSRFSFPLGDRIHRFPMPGIGLFSTACDVAKFCQMFINGGVYDGKRYLSAASVALMTTEQTPAGVKEKYGFGWTICGGGEINHGGSFNTCMSVNPSRGLIAIYLSQHTGPMVGNGGRAQATFYEAVGKLAQEVLSQGTTTPSACHVLPTKELMTQATKVIYKQTPQEAMALYILKPPTIPRNRLLPAVVCFTGGGWEVGDASGMIGNVAWFRDQGYIGISADYRNKKRHGTTPLESIQDAKSAIRYVRAHAKELGVDPNKIIAEGGSAGGHLAACTAMVEGHDEPGEDTAVSSKANALVLHNPALGGTGFGRDFFAKHPDCEPLRLVRSGLPPVILSNGTKDSTTPYLEARRFTEAMLKAGNRCELISISGAEHSCDWPVTNPHFLPTLTRMRDFLEKNGFSPAQKLLSFRPGELWPDDKGVHINAHGGGILMHDGVYYWFGEHKVSGDAGNYAQVGVGVYSSRDLYNWKNEGIALAVSDDPGSEIAKGCILERPKVAYNAKTRKFVMWFHLEFQGHGYETARAALAVSDKPFGPYSYVRSFRLDPGVWPLNATAEEKTGPSPEIKPKTDVALAAQAMRRDFMGGQMARDLTLFVDEDSTAYLVASSEDNNTLQIHQLSEDYQSFAGKWVRLFPGDFNEAPALFKHNGRYYMITSGCSGWTPNAARSAVADCIWGPWTPLGNPARGERDAAKITFGGQSTYVLPAPGKGKSLIFMADIWCPKDAIDGRYAWLPLEWECEKPVINWRAEWNY